MTRSVVRAAGVTAAVVALSVLVDAQQQPQNVPLETVMARAADYTGRFLDRFANVVTEERYEQVNTITVGGLTRRDRTTRSDLAFIRTGGVLAWTELRDVFDVDGRAVRDRDERLVRLFTEGAPDALDQGTRISEESARHNIGPGTRTVNTPVLPLLFLQQTVQPRFAFSLGARARAVGERVWIVNYREQTRPTIVRSDNDADLSARGRFWIDVDTGFVWRTEIELASLNRLLRLTTEFAPDSTLGVAVPIEMRERYEFGNSLTTGIATYGRFRSFAVTTDVVTGVQ